MSDPGKIRENVSRAYAKAITRAGPFASQGEGCCGGSPAGGVAAKIAGYRPEDVAALPGEAVETSFGCGNPLAFAEVRPGDVVLDLGSGAGLDLLIAARRVGPAGRVIGIDMTDAMIAKARANAAAAGLANVEVRKGIIEALPIETASVDWVISNCVINLSPEKPRVFAEIARVLRPGGRMLVSDIVVKDLPAWIRASEALFSSCIAGAIGEDEYLAGLAQAGLADAAVLERHVYGAAEIADFVRSELPGAARALAGGLVGRIAAAVEGKIASVRFSARRAPAS